MKNSLYFLFVILTLVIMFLSIYLGILITKLRLQRENLKRNKLKLLAEEKKRTEYIKESLRILALASLQGQCEISEACVRIKKLIEIDNSFSQIFDTKIIDEFYEKLSSFAYLEARDELTKKELFKEDSQRFQIEHEYKDQFNLSMQSLIKALSH